MIQGVAPGYLIPRLQRFDSPRRAREIECGREARGPSEELASNSERGKPLFGVLICDLLFTVLHCYYGRLIFDLSPQSQRL
jgi:hypothetical protein